YRAYGSVTVPQPVSPQGQQIDPAQYLDSQVLLLQSPGVARRAANIANRELHSNLLTVGDFSGADTKLMVTPPATAPPGANGASSVALRFEWPSARIAQVGANAVLQAFDAARAATIRAQADATVAGINHAIDHTSNQRQLGTLLQQRTQTVVNE